MITLSGVLKVGEGVEPKRKDTTVTQGVGLRRKPGGRTFVVGSQNKGAGP